MSIFDKAYLLRNGCNYVSYEAMEFLFLFLVRCNCFNYVYMSISCIFITLSFPVIGQFHFYLVGNIAMILISLSIILKQKKSFMTLELDFFKNRNLCTWKLFL